MIRSIAGMRKELGAMEFASLALIIAGWTFLNTALKPLQEANRRLDAEIVRIGREDPIARVNLSQASTPAAKLEAFYRFLDRPESRTQWLARLYSIGKNAGLQFPSAEYRLSGTRHRLVRYQIRLPVSGSYASVRRFLEQSLIEIPVLSLDQVSFRRRHASEKQIEAEIVLTLHLLKS
jgi:hypothetical protein